jgi:hypothetical protein
VLQGRLVAGHARADAGRGVEGDQVDGGRDQVVLRRVDRGQYLALE